MAGSSSGRLKKAEQEAIAAENARLQLRLGRAAHGYGVIAAMVLTFNAILAYLMEVTDIFADPPFSSAVVMLWTLPMMVGVGIGVFALLLKWGPYSYERTSVHFIVTWFGTIMPIIGILIVFLVEFGTLRFEYQPWIYPVSLLGLSLTMVSMALTWRGKGLRKVTSVGSSIIPIALLSLIMIMSPLPPSYLPLVMGYLGSAICYQLSGSMLHVLASSTSAQKRQIIRASSDRTATLGKELNSRATFLDRREKSLLAREAHLESYDKELSRAFMYIESRRKELHEFQAQIDKREHELLSMEKRIGVLKADADAKMSEMDIVRAEVKAQSEKSKQVREDLARMAATLQRREGKLRGREIQLDAKARELTSLEKAMDKERRRHEETRQELSTKRDELLARERELDAIERGPVAGMPAAEGAPPTLEEWEARLRQKEQELDATRDEFESKSSELQEWKAELEERGTMLAERFGDLKSREEEYINKESELAERESKLQEMQESFEMDKAALSKDSEQLKGVQENLRQLSAEARKKVTDYDSLKEELGTKEIELQHKSKTIGEFEERLQGESKSIDGRMKALIEREKLLEEREARMRLAAMEAAKAPEPGADPAEREKSLRVREERLRAKEREFKNRIYQREKELELREQALQQKLKEDISGMEEQVVEEKTVEKVRTGIAKLDDLMYGGIPFNSNVLFIGPSFLGKEIAILNFIAEGLRKGIPAVLVTTSKPPQEIAKDMTPILTEFVEYERIGLVKWIDATSQVQPNEMGFDASKRVYRVNGAADLGNILEGLHEIEAVLGDEHPYFRIAYLSLSPSVSHSEPGAAYDFIQRMVNELRKTRFVGAFALEKGMHDQKEIETIEHQMDGAIMFKEEDTKTFLSVQGVCDVQTRDWVQYKRTDRGLIIGAFSLERIK